MIIQNIHLFWVNFGHFVFYKKFVSFMKIIELLV